MRVSIAVILSIIIRPILLMRAGCVCKCVLLKIYMYIYKQCVYYARFVCRAEGRRQYMRIPVDRELDAGTCLSVTFRCCKVLRRDLAAGKVDGQRRGKLLARNRKLTAQTLVSHSRFVKRRRQWRIQKIRKLISVLFFLQNRPAVFFFFFFQFFMINFIRNMRTLS